MATKRPRLTNLSHFSAYGHDVEASIAFYRDTLGYDDVWRQAGPNGMRALIRINDRQFVELVPEIQPNTDRLCKFGFVTDDAQGMRAYLAEHGVQVPSSVSKGPSGNLTFAVKDPDDHTLEFIQNDPSAWPMRGASEIPFPDRISSCLMHIGFTSYSLDKSMSFYRDILGCKEMWRGSRDKKQLSWVQLTLPDSIDYIEFMLYDTPPSLERLGVLNHFGLEVPDIRDARELLAGRKAYTGYPRPLEPTIGVCHHRILNAFDPDGTRAEMMERSTYDGLPRPSTHEPPPR